MLRTFSGSNRKKKLRTFSLSPKIRRSYKKMSVVKYQFSLPCLIQRASKRHPFWAKSPRQAHYMKFSPYSLPGVQWPCNLNAISPFFYCCCLSQRDQLSLSPILMKSCLKHSSVVLHLNSLVSKRPTLAKVGRGGWERVAASETCQQYIQIFILWANSSFLVRGTMKYRGYFEKAVG